jgi:thiol:disulfide interchange protein DsbD
MKRVRSIIGLGFVALAVMAALPLLAAAQDNDLFGGTGRKGRENTKDRLIFKAAVNPTEAKRGEVIKLTITGIPKPGFHTYPLTQLPSKEASAYVSKLEIKETSGLKPLPPVTESSPDQVQEQGIGLLLEYKKEFTWSQDVLIPPEVEPGIKTLKLNIFTQVCDEHGCVPVDADLEAEVKVAATPAVALSPALQERLKTNRGGNSEAPAGTEKAGGSKSIADQESTAAKGSTVNPFPITEAEKTYQESMHAVAKQIQTEEAGGPAGLLAFMLTGVFWGAVSLVTPCVFPMIPITVSFFLKQSEKAHYRPLTMAVVYCATIVVVLTIAAVALLSFFRWLSINYLMNYALGALFVFFALSLFGMYDIELPSGLARFTSSREGQGGLVGVMFMALTFTIVSFACVAPFLGGFGGTAASAGLTMTHRILGGFAFAATFAFPFFILALFPNLLRQMPKSGSWLNSVKVVMGFLELAAALKFFRAAELIQRPIPEYFTYDLVMGMWIALSLLCGLYLLNFYRLPYDTPAENIGVPRLLFGFLFISLGFYLVPALFQSPTEGEKQRPKGAVYAWIDSFLLPEPTQGKGELPWTGNLPRAITEVRALRQGTGQAKFIFIDFTGKTCTNCKLNEREVFSKPDIKALFKPFTLVQLYTDEVPDEFYSSELRTQFGGKTTRQQTDARQVNLPFQREVFGTEQLPLYVILEPLPDGKIRVVARYDEGKINDVEGFAQFLKKPFSAEGGAQARAGGR